MTNVQLIAQWFRADDNVPAGQVTRAVAATRSLDMIVEDTPPTLAKHARTPVTRGRRSASCCTSAAKHAFQHLR